MLIFLSKFRRFYNILAKIFNDLPFPCQDLQGSLTFLSRSLRIFKSLAKIFNLAVKIFKDLSFFLLRSSKIFQFIAKIFKGLLFSFQDL